MWKVLTLSLGVALLGGIPAGALTIQVDYRYDTKQFFSAEGNPQGAAGAARARAALEAAAARWSAIIDQPLAAVQVRDDNDDPRIRFEHPGAGVQWQVSPAGAPGTDSLVREGGLPQANEYRGGWGIESDVWILYVGARDLGSSLAVGGTGLGRNWTSVFNDPASIHNRRFNVGQSSLPVWGGWISFNLGSTVEWNLDHTRGPAATEADLYSIALHEIGHALGLNSGGWADWARNLNGGFVGKNALANYNVDNAATLDRILLLNDHWRDDLYQSKIFPNGSPNYAGTVGAGVLQALLMESRIPNGSRLEVTSVEVGALQDVGWSVISSEVVAPVAAKNLKVARAADGSIELSWGSVAGASYTIQTSADGRSWSDVTPPQTAGGELTTWRDGDPAFVDPTPPALQVGRKFYRILSR